MVEKTKTVQVNFRPETIEKIEALAKASGHKKSSWIRHQIEKIIENLGKSEKESEK